MIQMSKYFVKKLSCPNLHNCLSRPVPAVVHILTSLMFPCGVLVENQSPVTLRPLSYSGLNRQLDLLYHFVSQFPPRKVMKSLVGVAHFQVFIMQRHAIDCFVRRHDYVSTLPVRYFTSGYFVYLEVGEGQMILFRYLWRVMHKSNLGSGKATTFLPKISKLPRLTPPPQLKTYLP